MTNTSETGAVQIFDNPDFGKIRVIMIDGEPWFIGKDVAEVLGYKDTDYAIRAHCKHARDFAPDETPGANFSSKARKFKIIPESDVYRLIIKSKLPAAEKFETWVMEEVLPTARKIRESLSIIRFKGNIDNIVYSKDNQPITTSRIIAREFGKRHDQVLRDIDDVKNKLHPTKLWGETPGDLTNINSIRAPDKSISANLHVLNQTSESTRLENLQDNKELEDFVKNNFKEVTYINDRGRTYREYELTEQGFYFVVLGYTGRKADVFKVKFINAFFRMQKTLIDMIKAKIIEEVLPQNTGLRQYVYIIKNPLTDHIKIGVAHDVQKRLKQLETGAGVNLEVAYRSLLCSNAFKVEKAVHNQFDKNKIFGEWYNANVSDVVDFLETQEFVLKTDFANVDIIEKIATRDPIQNNNDKQLIQKEDFLK